MKTVRIWFKKTGLAIYISHLDMNRLMSRAVIRAKIPLWYTEGFNPKPYLNFLLPLALGQEGQCEPLDIRIEGEISNEEIKEKLSAVMPDGIEIIDVTDPVMKSNTIAAAEYCAKVYFDSGDKAALFAQKASALIAGGDIQAEKKSKRGVKTVNLCEMVSSFSAEQADNAVICSTVVATGSQVNLNPELLINVLLEKSTLEAEYIEISRIAIFVPGENNLHAVFK